MFELVPYSNRVLANSWFHDFFADGFFGSQSSLKADVFSDGEKLVIEAELPGFSKDEINVKVNDNQLTISAQRKDTKEEKSENYIRRERSVSQVCRTFVLDNLDPDQVQASFENGLLRLTVPKPQELEPKIKEIDIE